MNRTELHLHDHYSQMDGLNTAVEYMERAKELGMTHIAQTNHGTLAGHRDFQQAAQQAGIVPILGVEAYISVTDRFDKRATAKRQDGTSAYNHIILLAQNETGLKSMYQLNQIGWTEGFYSKPRIDLDALEEHNEGLVVLSGCLNGLMAKAIERGDNDAAVDVAIRLKSFLGDRFFVELQAHNPIETNTGLLEIADYLSIPVVATSDCHYARKEDLWIEEALLILSTSPKIDRTASFSKSEKMDVLERFNYLYPDRKMTFEQIEIYLHNAAELDEQFLAQGIDRPELHTNTMEIARSVEGYPFHQGLDLLPKPKNEDPNTLLERKARQGLKKRGLDKEPQYVARLEEELKIIRDKNFSTYFLIMADMMRWSQSKSIRIGPGRGSAAGSLVCYSLYVTNVDPIKFNLLFFRFMDPEREDWPDVDSDFQKSRRGEVKEYLRRKFVNVGSIATYNKFQGKNALKDAARVFQVPLAETNRATKNVDAPSDKPEIFWDMFEKSDIGREYLKKYPYAVKLAKILQGRIRGGGMHAAGIVIANQPIANFAPIETAKDPNDPNGPRVPLVAMDMEVAADVGLIKLDVLGLKTLDVIDDTLKLIKTRTGRDIDLDTIGLDDKKVYAMISDGWTKGVFQCEAAPYTTLILKMGGVWNFDELAASNALVRPGAMNTIGAEYIARKNGKHVVRFKHAVMEDFTKDTYGEVLYQEQVMQTMTELAGMTMSEANKVRKIIGKKKDVREFDAFRSQFVRGASEKVDQKVAEELWHDFEAHAGYSFNKSHAVAYSMLSYWTAWLKYHYPLEFMTSVLNHEGDKDALTEYLMEAKRLGIKIFLPHVNKSKTNFVIEDKGIRFGLKNVKYISEKTAPIIVKNAPYKNYAEFRDFVLAKGSGLNSRVISVMNYIGGADFPDNPRRGDERDYFYEYLGIPAFNIESVPPKVSYQFRTLDEYDDKEAFVVMAMVRKIKTGTGWARLDVIDETATAGIFTNENTPIETGQMYAMLVSNNRVARFATMSEVVNKERTLFVEYLYRAKFPDVPDGMKKVISFSSRETRAGKKMAHVVLSSGDKELESAMVFPQNYIKAYSGLKEGSVVDVIVKETEDGSKFIDRIL